MGHPAVHRAPGAGRGRNARALPTTSRGRRTAADGCDDAHGSRGTGLAGTRADRRLDRGGRLRHSDAFSELAGTALRGVGAPGLRSRRPPQPTTVLAPNRCRVAARRPATSPTGAGPAQSNAIVVR